MPWPKTGATQWYTLLRLRGQGRTIKGLLIYNNLDVGAFIPVKRSDPMLLSTVHW